MKEGDHAAAVFTVWTRDAAITDNLSYDARYADLLFEVVTRRYEAQRPILFSKFTRLGRGFPP